MSKIYWNMKEMKMPEGAHVDRSDGSVFVYLDEGKTIRTSKKRVIGHATSETTMHPNEYFRQTYPSLWKEAYGEEKAVSPILRIGLFSLTLGIARKCHVYQNLIDSYGPEMANRIMDYSMYSILSKTNVAMGFEERMTDEELFSRKRMNRNDIGRLFSEELVRNKNDAFKKEWIKACAEMGKKEAWICVDGTNMDCQADIPEAEKGHDKTRKGGDIVGCMYAVSADDGLPLTYVSYSGSVVDSKAFMDIIAHLSEYGIGIKGIILDRGFCTKKVIDMIRSLGYPFVIMLKSDNEGYMTMMERHSAEIYWKVDRIIGKDGLFGISDKARIFAGDSEESNVSLYFDAMNGTERSVTLLNKIIRALGEEKGDGIPAGLEEYLTMKDGRIEVNRECLQKAVDKKGYSAIASSTLGDPAELNRIYHLRDASETQYMIMKSQLGNSVMRIHTSEGLEGKMMACFVSSIIRCHIMNACKTNDLATNRMTVEIDRLHLYMDSTGIYRCIHDESKRQRTLLESFGITAKTLDAITADINGRMNTKVSSQERKIPDLAKEAKAGRPRKKKEENKATERRGRGRPKGSRNKKTIEREKTNPPQPKRGRGRPKGSKNRKKKTASKKADSTSSK